MKIVAVLGSPRPQGNSSTLARAFLKAAGERGAEITEYLLNQMDFQGCQGCGACKTKRETCILEDDLTPVLQAVRDADLLVLASPVYFGDLSGQLKCFFDRTYSFFNPDFSCRVPPGKQAVMVLTQANPDPDGVRRHLSPLPALAEAVRLRPHPPPPGRRRPGARRGRLPGRRPWMRPPPWPGSWCRFNSRVAAWDRGPTPLPLAPSPVRQ